MRDGLDRGRREPASSSCDRWLVLAVPTLTGSISSGVVRSIVDGIEALRNAGWRVSFWPWERSAIIQHARNEIVASFLETTATHLLMVDDDIEFNPTKLVRFVERPVDVVAGVYRGRGCNGPLLWRGPKTIRDLTEPRSRARAILAASQSTNGLVEAEAVGSGLLRVTRSCLERWSDAAPRYRYHGAECADLFSVVIDGDGQMWTEDFTFCNRWRELGGKVWIDPEIETGHAYRELALCALSEELEHARRS